MLCRFAGTEPGQLECSGKTPPSCIELWGLPASQAPRGSRVGARSASEAQPLGRARAGGSHSLTVLLLRPVQAWLPLGSDCGQEGGKDMLSLKAGWAVALWGVGTIRPAAWSLGHLDSRYQTQRAMAGTVLVLSGLALALI